MSAIVFNNWDDSLNKKDTLLQEGGLVPRPTHTRFFLQPLAFSYGFFSQKLRKKIAWEGLRVRLSNR